MFSRSTKQKIYILKMRLFAGLLSFFAVAEGNNKGHFYEERKMIRHTSILGQVSKKTTYVSKVNRFSPR